MSSITDLNIILARLVYLDELCGMDEVIGEIVLLGGSGILAYMQMKGKHEFRPTMDIDVEILNSNKSQQQFRKILSKANIDVVGGVMEVPPPEDFECRRNHYVLDLDFQNITVYVPTIELLVCTKLFTKRQKDLDDLTNTSILEECDLIRLEKMVEEYTENLLNPDDPFLNYHHLDGILSNKGLK